jgi:hypothetical protein
MVFGNQLLHWTSQKIRPALKVEFLGLLNFKKDVIIQPKKGSKSKGLKREKIREDKCDFI